MNQGNVSLSVNGNKVSSTLDINMFSDSLPPEVANLLRNQLKLNTANNEQKTAPVEEVKVRIRDTMYPEAGNDIVKKEIEAYLKSKKEESLVKTLPQHVQRALEQRDALEKSRNEKVGELTIFESGVALGIVVGTSTKEEVSKIMENYSKVQFVATDSTPIHFYSDISLYVFYDDNCVVQELKFVNDYRGMTSKGLKLGDTLEKAIDIYAQPKMKSAKGAVWDRFAVFCDHNIINSIRLQK